VRRVEPGTPRARPAVRRGPLRRPAVRGPPDLLGCPVGGVVRSGRLGRSGESHLALDRCPEPDGLRAVSDGRGRLTAAPRPTRGDYAPHSPARPEWIRISGSAGLHRDGPGRPPARPLAATHTDRTTGPVRTASASAASATWGVRLRGWPGA